MLSTHRSQPVLGSRARMSSADTRSQTTGPAGLDGARIRPAGVVPGHKLGRRWIFLRDEIEAAVRGEAQVV